MTKSIRGGLCCALLTASAVFGMAACGSDDSAVTPEEETAEAAQPACEGRDTGARNCSSPSGSTSEAAAEQPTSRVTEQPAENPDQATAEAPETLVPDVSSCDSGPCGVRRKTNCTISCALPLAPVCFCQCDRRIFGYCVEENPHCSCQQ